VEVPVELQSLVDIYDQPFVIINPDHRVVVVNRAFEERYGVSRDAAAGRACFSLVACHNRPSPCGPEGANCPFGDVFRRGVSQASAHTYHDAEGREHVVRVQGYPVRTTSGEIYLGELIQEDALRHHPDTEKDHCPEARLIGDAPAFRQTLGQLVLAAGSEAPVLLQGETGTGKELAAAYIHRHSARHDRPFHTLDCSSLTEDLFESEVFGHERGAFTGSTREKPGMFEIAHRGTLFLDEIGELSLPQQAKLLRVLESGQFRRVGGTRMLRADVRIVSATNRRLWDSDWFRNDLYFRIACVTVNLPPLTKRRSDIPALAQELLARIGRSSGQRFTLDDEALYILQSYDYPGNVRELRNILWVAAVNSPNGLISAGLIAAALPERVNGCDKAPEPTPVERMPRVERSSMARVAAPPAAISNEPPPRGQWEADHLKMVLDRHDGNRRAVAAALGVSERTVYRKLRKFGLG
jgi:transcriptional regulator with PAS, ATPase and Fis domain